MVAAHVRPACPSSSVALALAGAAKTATPATMIRAARERTADSITEVESEEAREWQRQKVAMCKR